jgi:outer membrane lipoprotein-sorting protein
MRADRETPQSGRRSIKMPGIHQPVWIAALLSGWLAGAAVRAETIPLPRAAPESKDRSTPAARSIQPGSTQSAAPAVPSILDLTGRFLESFKSNHPATDPAAFDAKQRALVNRVSAYLTSVQVLTGNFVQIAPDGWRSTGRLFVQKPGKVRFEYDPPSPIEVIADGSQVVVADRKSGTQDPYPLSQTPLRFLLADKIDLLQDTNVVGITVDDTYVSITIEERQALVGKSRLLMMFDSKSFKLKQWTITDIQGFDTTIAVSNLDTSKRLDPNLFRFDYTHYMQ